MEKYKKWIGDIVLFLWIISFPGWIISFFISIFYPGGWCINSKTIDELYLI